MLYVMIDETGVATQVKNGLTEQDRKLDRLAIQYGRNGAYQTRNDWKTWEDVMDISLSLNLSYKGERTFIPTDAGPQVHPRFDVIELPKVGDDVSYGFNGDYYSCGKIISISKGPVYRKIVTRKIVTQNEEEKWRVPRTYTFWRRRFTGTWLRGGMWALVRGVHDEWNPEF